MTASKLDDIMTGLIKTTSKNTFTTEDDADIREAKQQIKDLFLELIGDVEPRGTEDMSLNSWTPDDYKAFGKNELKIELRQKVNDL